MNTSNISSNPPPLTVQQLQITLLQIATLEGTLGGVQLSLKFADSPELDKAETKLIAEIAIRREAMRQHGMGLNPLAPWCAL